MINGAHRICEDRTKEREKGKKARQPELIRSPIGLVLVQLFNYSEQGLGKLKKSEETEKKEKRSRVELKMRKFEYNFI